MKLFVAITLLTIGDREERVHLLHKWIEIAIETRTSIGNLFGFTSIMLGLTLPEVILLYLSKWIVLCKTVIFVNSEEIVSKIKTMNPTKFTVIFILCNFDLKCPYGKKECSYCRSMRPVLFED